MENSPNCDFSRFVIAFQVLHSVPPQELTFSGAVVVLIQHAHSYGRLKRATFCKKTMQPLWKIDPSRDTCTYHTQFCKKTMQPLWKIDPSRDTCTYHTQSQGTFESVVQGSAIPEHVFLFKYKEQKTVAKTPP